mgnify:CR=1 FL=1
MSYLRQEHTNGLPSIHGSGGLLSNEPRIRRSGSLTRLDDLTPTPRRVSFDPTTTSTQPLERSRGLRSASPVRASRSPTRDLSPSRRDPSPSRRDSSPSRRDYSPRRTAFRDYSPSRQERTVNEVGTPSSTSLKSYSPCNVQYCIELHLTEGILQLHSKSVTPMSPLKLLGNT